MSTVTQIETFTSREQIKQFNAAISGKYWRPDKKSIRWFMDKIKQNMKTSMASANTKLTIGHMYIYRYNAKWKDSLPFWDAMPLVIPIGYYKDGFLGINLHYLPPKLRAILMKDLIKTMGTKAGPRQYIKASYDKLNSIAGKKIFQPCVKRYLYSHLQSKFLRVPPIEWHRAILIPMAKWKKSNTKKIYAHSRSMF